MMFKTVLRLLPGLALAGFSLSVSAQSLIVGSQRDTALLEPHLEYSFLGLSQLRDATILCVDREDPDAEDASWDDAAARAIASLHASEFSAAFVARVETALDSRGTINCENPIIDRVWTMGMWSGPDWSRSIAMIFEGYDIAFLETAPDPAQFDTIAAALRAAGDKMAQSIECDVVSRPYDGTIGFLLRYWYDALEAGARKLRAEGYPPGWIEEIIASARIGAFDYIDDLDERLAMDMHCRENRDAHFQLRLMSRDDFSAVVLEAIGGEGAQE